MGKPDIADNPVNYLAGEQAGHGGLALGLQAKQDREALQVFTALLQDGYHFRASRHQE